MGDVSSLRRTCALLPGTTTPANPAPRQPYNRQVFPAPDHRPPLASIKLVRPRPRPDRRSPAGADTTTLPDEGLCAEGSHPSAERLRITTAPNLWRYSLVMVS